MNKKTENLEKKPKRIETREFSIDKNVIYHLIKSQSNSKSDALIELIQNSFDAKATKCFINIKEDGFSCKDNGNGFGTKQDILNFFEVFGKAHEENNLNRFGRFRMGRGQIMAQAKTNWVSSSFTMNVDIKNNGLEYDLVENKEIFSGCLIKGQWYNKLNNNESGWTEVESLKEQIIEACKYIHGIEIFINGDYINKPIEEKTFENDDYYFIENKKYFGLSVYNLGVSVFKYPFSRSLGHIKGVIVSKKHLSLNTSRNEVLEECKVWERIVNSIKKVKPLQKNNFKLSLENSRVLVNEVIDNNLNYEDILKTKFLYQYDSRKAYSLYNLTKTTFKYITFDTTNLDVNDNIFADKMLQEGLAIPLSLKPFDNNHIRGQNVNKFFQGLRNFISSDKHSYYHYNKILKNLKDFEDLKELIDGGEKQILKDSSISIQEQCAIKALRQAVSFLTSKFYYKRPNFIIDIYSSFHRNIVAGSSLNKLGWTDGESYIALNKELLKNMSLGITHTDKVITTYLHEICHKKGETEIHNVDFYEKYHLLTSAKSYSKNDFGIVSFLSYTTNKQYARQLEKNKLKVPKSVLRGFK